MNHGQAFWQEVEKVLPNYLMLEAELRLVEKSRGANLKLSPTPAVLSSYYATTVAKF
jgi:hypothetical protein